MGRSRGGLATRAYAATDAQVLMIKQKLPTMQAHFSRCADDKPGMIGPRRTLLADAARVRNRLIEYFAGVWTKAAIGPTPCRSSARLLGPDRRRLVGVRLVMSGSHAIPGSILCKAIGAVGAGPCALR